MKLPAPLLLILALPLQEEKEIPTAFLAGYVAEHYPGDNFGEYLYVSVLSQRLYHLRSGKVVKSYDVSTSKHGTGAVKNSNQTPTGLHEIRRKIGEGVPVGGILKGRVYTGRSAGIITEKRSVNSDDVTTRILWLAGREPGVNQGGEVDSYERFIYIHGTPEEGLIGTPVSHGCIRMRNTDVEELYDKVREGMMVVILER